MEQMMIREILEKLNQIQVDINIIKQKLPEEEIEFDVERQIKEGLEDLKQGRIIRLA